MADHSKKLPPVLVTGATGFVGSRLARRLVDEAEEVHLLVRADSNLDQLASIVDRVRIHRWDGGTESLDALFATAKPEVVFHLASLFLAAHLPTDVPRLVASNVQFGAMLLEAATGGGVKRFVNTGTNWEHFHDTDRAVNLYAATKQAFEHIVAYYCDSRGLRTVTLKLFDTYGPGDPRPKLMAALVRAAREKRVLEMSPGEQLLDMVYIEDAVDAFVGAAVRTAALPPGAHEQYAVSSGKPLTLRQLVAEMSQSLGIEIPVRFGAKPYRDREVMIPWTAGKPLPGWTPKVTLADGLRQLESLT